MEHRNIRNVDIATINQLPKIDFIGNDFAIFDDVRDVPFFPYPARLDAACFIVCLRGHSKLNISLRACHLQANTMAVILPDQIVQQLERSDDFSGLFIAVAKDFMDEVIPTLQKLFPLFFRIKEAPCVGITPEEVESFREYHSFLWKKVKLKESQFRKEITKGLLLSLFYEIYTIYQGHTLTESRPKSRKEELFERFIRHISAQFKQERSVTYYADKMCLTPKHLSTAVKEVSGKTASEWIDGLVLLEAKALLKSSEMSIQEISEELHFANQSFFGKYFKHHLGMSPKEYRKLGV